MSDTKINTWTDEIRAPFNETGESGGDFWYVLSTLEHEKPMSFTYFLSKISNGYGCTIHEGLGFSLENDWDDPSEFDDVSFFAGEKEISLMPTRTFVNLLAIACNQYVAFFPNEQTTVMQLLGRIRDRYA